MLTGRPLAVPLVEARDPGISQAPLDHAVSRVNIIPPAEVIARHVPGDQPP
ncbi:hypothetical protein ACFVY4_22125 [Streptomyces sp. NPDC058299]|uniref:hypothetical protein n=1 Tax=Streptomyces sp. NPDC058299 TaxID=3346435 RepID=UPI0036EEC2F2